MTGPAYRLTPWPQVVRPHEDVIGGALDMGTYAANLAGVLRRRPNVAPVYVDPARFFAATHLTTGLRALLTDTLRVLGGGDGPRVLQLRTPFGGGKTHTLVALLHLARDREAAASTSEEVAALPDPGPVKVAVLSGEELDPLSPMTTAGVETHTLWGEMAAQLGRYDLVARHDREGSAPGGDVLRQVLGDGPTLILLDEALVYIEKAMAVPRAESTAGRQALLFVQALTEAVNAHPRAATVYSLQASVGEAAGAEGLLFDLDKLVSRIDAKREPVSGDEVLRVVQRRLFSDLGDERIRREVARAYADLLRHQLRAMAETDDARREAATEASLLEERVLASYPFHPALLDLMYHRWGSLPSYQRTRGALQFLACAVNACWRQGASCPLVGPGDIDLADPATRGAFFSQVGERERYTSVLAADVTGETTGAKIVDRRLGANSPTIAQLAVGTRVATAVMLYSFGAREGEESGVLQDDLVTSLLTPGLDRSAIITALHDLREEELYLHYTGRRYRFEPRANLSKLVRDEANKLMPAEVLERVRHELEHQFAGAAGVLVWPDGPADVGDGNPLVTVVYLAPSWSSNRQPLERFIEDARSGPRRYRNGIALAIPDRQQFDQARHSMRMWMAAEHLLRRRTHYGFTEEQADELQEKVDNARRDAVTAIGRAYREAVVPAKALGGDAPYALETADLRSRTAAGRSLHERVVDALSNRVFGSVTVDKLLALAGLGPARRAVSCRDLVDWFYGLFDFTKLWSRRAIAEAISRAVEEGRAGYVVGLVRADGVLDIRDPRAVRLGELLPVDEVDLSEDAALLWVDYARELRTAESAAKQGEVSGVHVRTTPEPINRTSKGPTPVETTDSGAEGVVPPARVGDAVYEVIATAQIERPGLFNLIRSLSWLREHPAEVDIHITVHARSGEPGLERVSLRNGFIEPLEEGASTIEVQTK